MDKYHLDEVLLEKVKKKVKKKKYQKHNVLSSNTVIKNDRELICFLVYYQHKPYKCEKCKLDGLWQGKVIDLLVYRKNKNAQDNTLSNLKLLCPNCLALQTSGQTVYQHLNQSKMSKCLDCGKRFRKKKIVQSVNPLAAITGGSCPKITYYKERCDFCIRNQAQKKDYRNLDNIHSPHQKEIKLDIENKEDKQMLDDILENKEEIKSGDISII